MTETNYEFPLSQKAQDFILSKSATDFLEGTTYAGKTWVGSVKFMLKVSESYRQKHLIAGYDTGTVEANIIPVILKVFTNATYYGNGNSRLKQPHIEFENKDILIFGFSDSDRWSKIRGGEYGAVFVDECNLAHIEFLREISTRYDYGLFTLNPDSPGKPVYKEFINHSRPFKKYESDVPEPILKDLYGENYIDGQRYWFFSFNDNLAVTKDEIDKRISRLVPGTKQYRSRVLGLRCKDSGVVFSNFSATKNIITKQWLKDELRKGTFTIKSACCGVDTAYSWRSEDTTVFIYELLLSNGFLVIADEEVYNNKENPNELLDPQTMVRNLINFLKKNDDEWGQICRYTYVDSADKGTLTTALNYKKTHLEIPWGFYESYKLKITDRIRLVLSWIQSGAYLVCDNCVEHINEMNNYSWDEKKDSVPEDANNHTIDASSYGWSRWMYQIAGSGEGIEDIKRRYQECQ